MAINYTEAYNLLAQNQSVIGAAINTYDTALGGLYFWPILFLFTLLLIAIKTQSYHYTLFYAVAGNVLIGSLLPIRTSPIFYGVMVFSLMLVLWSFYSNRNLQ